MLNLKKFKHVHCIGIGGIGLSAIAEIFLTRGYQVSGSDMKESEITDKLIGAGRSDLLRPSGERTSRMRIWSYILPRCPRIIRRSSPLWKTVSRRRPGRKSSGALMKEYENSIAIAGTHGKTTTTSMVSLILENFGKDPTILVGGNLQEINGNVKIGHSAVFHYGSLRIYGQLSMSQSENRNHPEHRFGSS